MVRGKRDPGRRANKGELVTVQYKAHDKPVAGSNTYGIWYTETRYDVNGQQVGTKTWRARSVYVQKMRTDEFAKSVNGLGILATELSVEPVEERRNKHDQIYTF